MRERTRQHRGKVETVELFDVIHERRSYRGDMSPEPVDAAQIDRLIEAAAWAPSPFNVQPWELVFITESGPKVRLAEITIQSIQNQFKDPRFLDANGRWMRLSEEEWRRKGDGVLLAHHVDLPRFITDPERLRPLMKNARHLRFLGYLGAGKAPAETFGRWVREAPLLLLAFIDWQRQCPGEAAKDWMLLGMGAMLQNMLLAAADLGLAVQFISAPLESDRDRGRVREVVDAPPHLEPIALLRLGYPEHATPISVRRSGFIHYEKWEENDHASE